MCRINAAAYALLVTQDVSFWIDVQMLREEFMSRTCRVSAAASLGGTPGPRTAGGLGGGRNDTISSFWFFLPRVAPPEASGNVPELGG